MDGQSASPLSVVLNLVGLHGRLRFFLKLPVELGVLPQQAWLDPSFSVTFSKASPAFQWSFR